MKPMRSKLDALARVLYLYHFGDEVGNQRDRMEATLQIVGKEGLHGLMDAIRYEIRAAFPEDEAIEYDYLPEIWITLEHVMYEVGLINEIYCPEEQIDLDQESICKL
jgi:hypothetical protein